MSALSFSLMCPFLPSGTHFRNPILISLLPTLECRNDPTPDRGQQLPRAASLIVSSLGFIHDLRAGMLEPDTVRGTPLDMDQYTRLFGTARIPTEASPSTISPASLAAAGEAQAWL